MPRTSLKSGASWVALAVFGAAATIAQAQDDEDATSNRGIELIVVTAEKTEKSLQETAAAVTALPGETLIKAGVTDLRDTQMLVPAARFQKEGSTTQVFVRGVGSNLDFGNVEPTVGFNFNGVYIPREGTSTAFFDIASVEVLPGPQGTLYGRSTMGGTVNVSFVRPEHNNSGRIILEGGNYAMFRGTLGQNLSLADGLAIRIAANYFRHEGYNDSGADSADDFAGRLSVLYEPTRNFTAYLWAAYSEKNGKHPNLVNHGFDPVTMSFDPNAFLTENPWNDLREGPLEIYTLIGQPTANDQVYENFTFGGQFDLDLGFSTLTYIPGYIHLDSSSSYWLGAVPAAISQNYRMHSHELRIAGASGRFEWLGGLYYYDQRNFGDFVVFFTLLNVDIRENLLDGFGVFGQVTYSLSDTVRLTVGARFSADDRHANGFGPQPLPAPGAPPDPASAFVFDEDYSDIDWKAAIEWDVGPEIMAYVSAQTAYAPGTYNSTPSTPTFDNAVKAADLTAFAAGFKSRFFDGTLQINPEFYYYIYKDLIIQAFDQSVIFNPIFNAQEVRNYGAQIDVLWQVTPNDLFNFSLGYTHARNKEFVTPAGDDFTGLQPPYAPDWTVIAGYSHDFELPKGVLNISANGRYESSWFADYVHNPGTRQKPHAKGDASLTYYADGGWSLGVWVKNFTNTPVLAATAAAGFPGPATAYLENPRTFGARASLTY